jgi:hypothetical protein
VVALFEGWDKDGGGTIEMQELQAILRRPVELDASLKAGAVAVQTSAKGKHALRKGPSKKTSVVGAIDLDESEGALPVQVQLQHALAKSSARVIDLFKELDVDGDGTVSAKEFRIAMPLLGLNVPRADVDALFSSWDPDGSGTLTLKELEKVLRRPMELDAKLKAGGAGAIELTAKNKNALRVKEDA